MLSVVQNVGPSSAESGLRSVCVNCQVPPTQFSLYMGGVSAAFEKVHGGQSFFLVSPESMTIGPVSSGSFLTGFSLLPGRPSVDLLWGTRFVLFLVCPFMSFSHPRSRGCDEAQGWMGLRIPSDCSTRVPFDFIPCEGSNRLGIGCVCVCAIDSV